MTIVWPVACGTGHRDIPRHRWPWLREQAYAICCTLRDECGTETVWSGMAYCWDLIWARAAVRAGLELWAAVPFPQQPDRWEPAAHAEWRRLLDLAAKVVTVAEHFSVGALHARNDLMLAKSAAVVACLRSSATSGGTFSAVRKARKRGLPIVHLDPDVGTVEWPERPSNDPLNSDDGSNDVQMTLLL